MLKRSETLGRFATAVVILFAGLLLIVMFLDIPDPNQRQVVGRLTFDAAELPDQAHNVGQFRIAWTQEGGGRLSIAHGRQPDFLLWASLPGRSFATAAKGEETVIERRGHFRVEEKILNACRDQTVEAIDVQGDKLTVTGRLLCKGVESVPYILAFSALEPNQLGFRFSLDSEEFNRTCLTYASQHDERFYGFGEQFSAFNLKGKRLPVFINEQGIGRGAQPLTLVANLQYGVGGAWYSSYASVPHYITSHLHSFFLENSEYSLFDLRYSDRVHVCVFSPQMAGRILYGESPAELIAEYTSYVGRMRPLPDWVHEGAIVSLQGGTDRVRSILALLEEHEVPVTGLWLQDWVGQRSTSFGKQLWWNWVLDEEQYPEWDRLRRELAAREIRLLTYINPFLADVSEKPHASRNLFQEAAEQGFLVRDQAGEPYMIDNSDFSAALVDLTNPDACDWMRAVIMEEVIGAGVQGWMADFGEGLPFDARLASGESAAAYHNRYPEEWARINREALETQDNGDELFFFMRSGYRQSPGHSTAFWLGDQLVSWDAHDGIKTAVTGLLSGGMSGFSLNHSDIGGYTSVSHPVLGRHRSEELLRRWMELNAFTTLYRTHESNRPDENVQVYDSPELLDHFGRFARVYRAWGFYRRQLVEEAEETGLPVVRHMFINYPDDDHTYDLTYEQFMVGDEFIVAPVLDRGAEQSRVYLPAGRWVHLWSGNVYGSVQRGEEITVAAPLGEPGVFYQEGSSIAEEFLANLRNEGVID